MSVGCGDGLDLLEHIRGDLRVICVELYIYKSIHVGHQQKGNAVSTSKKHGLYPNFDLQSAC